MYVASAPTTQRAQRRCRICDQSRCMKALTQASTVLYKTSPVRSLLHADSVLQHHPGAAVALRLPFLE
eukprot:250757-Chlamydomonas_euryale.AAC.18